MASLSPRAIEALKKFKIEAARELRQLSNSPELSQEQPENRKIDAQI